MRIDHLNECVSKLDDAIGLLKPSRVRQLEWLRYDLHVVCREQITSRRLPRSHQPAWYRVTLDRLAAIQVPTRVRGPIDSIQIFLRQESSGASLSLKFGQMRIAGAFQVPNVNQQRIAGFPDDMAGSDLATVANRIQSGSYLPDQVPIRIFWHSFSNRWVVANNRGFTAHCIANVRPLRLWPTAFYPHDIEVTRLAEVEGLGGVPDFIGPRLGEPVPRRLPSDRMFVTPVENQIARVVQVPSQWG